MKYTNKKGFTLIELLITIAIVGILATIATPLYRDYLVEARRNAVKQTLVKATNLLENCYSLNHTYEGCFALNDLLKADDLDELYQDSGSTISKSGFTLYVKAQGAQESDTTCLYIGINRAGRKLSSNQSNPTEDANNCW